MYGIYYKQLHSYFKHHPSEFDMNITQEANDFEKNIYYKIKEVESEENAREFIKKDIADKLMASPRAQRVHSDLVYKKED